MKIMFVVEAELPTGNVSIFVDRVAEDVKTACVNDPRFKPLHIVTVSDELYDKLEHVRCAQH